MSFATETGLETAVLDRYHLEIEVFGAFFLHLGRRRLGP